MVLIRINKQVRDVYVVIDDSRRLIKALDILNHFGIKVKGVDLETRYIQGVILLDTKGYRYLAENNIGLSGYVINIDIHGFEKGIAMAIVYAKSLIVNPLKKVVIGIDYGRNIGLAVVVNDTVIYTHSYRSSKDVIEDVRFFIENVNTELKVIRIGATQGINEMFADTIIRLFKNVANIEFVPEYKSSKHKYLLEDIKLKPDEIAAINIAFYRTQDLSP